MSANPHDVAAAQAQLAAARARLFGTLGAVQDRLRPAHLAQDAVKSAAQGVASVARKGAEAVRSRPFAAAALAGMIGLVMARGLIGDAIRGVRETGGRADGLKRRTAKSAKKGR